jgi:hypothetical protein
MHTMLQRMIARLLLVGVSLWCAFGISVELVQAYEASKKPSCCCKTEAARRAMDCAKRAKRAHEHKHPRITGPQHKECCGSAECGCGLSSGELPGPHEGALALTSATISFVADLPSARNPQVRIPRALAPPARAAVSYADPPPAPPCCARPHLSGPPPYLRLRVLRD